MSLERAIEQGRTLRVIGFDDSPFDKSRRGTSVMVSGVVCRGTRFEGMVTTRIRKDGWNATTNVIASLRDSKFLPQLHLAMFDGIAFGGFNVLDLAAVEAALGVPAVAVMRNEPDMEAIRQAVEHLPRPGRRLELIARAGTVHESANCYFQCVGAPADVVSNAIEQLTDRGHIPEAIRIAHLIGSAVVTGESGRRA